MNIRMAHMEKTIIRVIGVGGAGGNAVEHMIHAGVTGVEFIAANSDAQAQARNMAVGKLYFGKSGTGADGGREAALGAREQIIEALAGAHMLFLVAGMGGGTGTGAAPVIAGIAREQGILTVAVAFSPFSTESRRIEIAEAGIAELQEQADSLIVLPNDTLLEAPGNDASVEDAFKVTGDLLCGAIGDIAGILDAGLVCFDFGDLRAVMGGMGMGMMGTASASGSDRARRAVEQVIASPWFAGVRFSGARGALVGITASSDLKMEEVAEVVRIVKEHAVGAHLVCGVALDEDKADELRVTMIVTGLRQAPPGMISHP